MKIEVYADGSAQTKDKPGGWASVILIDGVLHKELAGHLELATNNDAELIAAVKGLDYTLEYVASFQGSFPMETEVTLISDSQIILNWANGTYRFKQVDKMVLYEHLRRLVKKLNVKTQWVRGHSGNTWNERCDKLANDARKGITEETPALPNVNGNSRIGKKKTDIVCFFYRGKLKVLDLLNNICEDYNREVHGKRGSVLEFKEDKLR